MAKKTTKKTAEKKIETTVKEIPVEKIETPVAEKIIQVEKVEKVVLLFAGEVAKGTSIWLGNELGSINGSFNTVEVDKKDFIQKRSLVVDKMLKKRQLIVLNGLTDVEKKRYGLEYKDGELLTTELRENLLNLPIESLTNIFESLCEEHKKIVATVFIDEYEANNPLVTQEKVKALNKLSKSVTEKGLFTPILKDMGQKLGEE